MIHVIGSGPAGVACATALIRSGAKVTMLDAGITLEPEIERKLVPLRGQKPADWDPETISAIKGRTAPKSEGLPTKFVYGSDFPYRDANTFFPTVRDGVDSKSSLARGGLSNAWGAAVLPCRAEDMAAWPIGPQDLEPHYRAVLGLLPYSASRDDLERFFPLHADAPVPLRLSAQARALAVDLAAGASRLRADAIHFGSARLAIRAGGDGCVYCGMCLYGCPGDHIYSSSHTLRTLLQHENFTYRGDVVVSQLEERGGGVRIDALERVSRSPLTLEASRVYLACGAVPTTRLLLQSLQAFDHVLEMKDTQYFMFPFVRYQATEGVEKEELQTLAQLFVDIMDPAVASRTAHLQFYSYNDLYRAVFRGMLGPLHRLAEPVIARMLPRLWAVNGYLHSDDSPSFQVQLSRGTTPAESVLKLTAPPGSGANHFRKALMRKLWKHRSAFKGLPVPFMYKTGKPGLGYHYGGTFPMRSRPGPFESDTLGRPTGFRRVHIVDSTCFPSIPATTITLTSMANGYRIAAATAGLGDG